MAVEQQQQQAPAAAPPGVIPDDVVTPPAPVDVDIESGEVSQVEVPPAPKQDAEPPIPRTRPRPQARIQTLTHERDGWQNTAQRLEQELAESRRQAAEANAAKDQAERAGMENLVARTKAEVVAAEAALRQAKDANDPDAEVKAQTRLARAAAEEADADAWVATQPKPGTQTQQPQQQQQPQRPQQQEVQPVSGAVRDFIADNEWFSAVQMGSDGRPMIDQRTGRPVSNPNYDEDMHDVAMIAHKQIMKQVRDGKLAKDFVETPEYFTKIAEKVAAEFPEAFEGEEEEPPPPPRPRTPQMAPTKQPVAPSTRQVPGTPPPRQGAKMRLDGEEAALVRSLVDQGTMRYPRDHQDQGKRGQKMTYDDAYVKYAREKQTDRASRGDSNQ